MRFFLFFILCLLLPACSQANESTLENPELPLTVSAEDEEEETAIKEPRTSKHIIQEIMENNNNADIFYFNQIVYINAEDYNWVQSLELKVGEEIGEIKKNSKTPGSFSDWTATNLPIGTKLYKVENYPGPIYLAVIDGQTIPYLAIME